MKTLANPILDPTALYNRYVLREGFPFTSITAPPNVYDAILIKPRGETSWSPKYPSFDISIDEYIFFINKYKLTKALIISSDISFLKKCPSLKYLKIVPSDSADDNFDFSPLYEHPEVVCLSCHTEYGLNFMKHTSVDYSKIKGLIRLDISADGHVNTNCIDALKTLSISYNKADELTNLFNSKELDTLQVVASSIRSLNGIGQSRNLKWLQLYHNPKLADISALEDVKSTLKYLSIENCAKIKDFSVIEKLEQLEALYLFGSNSLPDLNFLKRMKSLKTFGFNVNILNGDLTPCLSLECAYCARVRKHYNLKEKQLPKASVDSKTFLKDIPMWRRL